MSAVEKITRSPSAIRTYLATLLVGLTVGGDAAAVENGRVSLPQDSEFPRHIIQGGGELRRNRVGLSPPRYEYEHTVSVHFFARVKPEEGLPDPDATLVARLWDYGDALEGLVTRDARLLLTFDELDGDIRVNTTMEGRALSGHGVVDINFRWRAVRGVSSSAQVALSKIHTEIDTNGDASAIGDGNAEAAVTKDLTT